MRNIEARLTKLDNRIGDKPRARLQWLRRLLCTIQGDDPEARAHIQRSAEGPITRYNTPRMQAVARRVLAELPEATQRPADST
jgi:hypothetical protein